MTEPKERGDFQTPPLLAQVALRSLRDARTSFVPRTIIEPTCGSGSFLLAAADCYPEAERVLGAEIDPRHISRLRKRLADRPDASRFDVRQGDYFRIDWGGLLADLPEPILVTGNPPWVTNSEISRLSGSNLPEKRSAEGLAGLDAVTGKSNFDISEVMLTAALQWLTGRRGCLAVLCKSAVARKVLLRSWKSGARDMACRMTRIDATKHFRVAVDACFLTIAKEEAERDADCECLGDFGEPLPHRRLGYRDGIVLSDAVGYDRHRDLAGTDVNYTWRSGMKHDCSKVMELHLEGDRLVNGCGSATDLEDEYLFPLLKGSDIGNGRTKTARRRVIVPQRVIGECTRKIEVDAPKTWAYLNGYAREMDGRASAVYRGRPPFSVFGVGPYTFAQWKVAICGLYKNLEFRTVGPIDGKPVVFDDTVYFLAASSREEAEFLCSMLNSKISREFLGSMVFWTDKRPITAGQLTRMHLGRLAEKLGLGEDYDGFRSYLWASSS